MHVKGAYPGDYCLLCYAKCQSTGSRAILWLIEGKFSQKTSSSHSPSCEHILCMQLALHTAFLFLFFVIGSPAIYVLVRLELFMLLFCTHFFAQAALVVMSINSFQIHNISKLLHSSFLNKATFPQLFFFFSFFPVIQS